MQARKYIERHGDNAGAAWLRRRGGDIKGSGVGCTNDIAFDRNAIRTNAKDANTAYLRDRHGKGSQ
jgi:hypothetical protein